MNHPADWTWSQVFITVPHGLCLPGVPRRYHYCDFLAQEAAGRLYAALDAPAEIFYPSGVEEARVNVDLNRPVSRTTNFRTRLTQRTRGFAATGKDNLLVLDVHSFPGATARGWADYDLVILESWPGGPTTYARDLKEFLASREMRVLGTKIKLDPRGSVVNDIYSTSLAYNQEEFKVGALLLEFNEGVEEDGLEELVNGIAEWVTN